MTDTDQLTEDEWSRLVNAASVLLAADQLEHEVTPGVEYAGQSVRLVIGNGLAVYYGTVRPDGTATVRRADALERH